MKKPLILLAGCLLGASAFAACYTVMDAQGNTVSESPNPPVDMSRHLHETVPGKYGEGATMTFSVSDSDCGQHVDTWDDGTAKPAAAATPAKPEAASAKPGKKSKRAAHPARHKPQTRHKPQAPQPAQPVASQPAKPQPAPSQPVKPQPAKPQAQPAKPQPAQPQPAKPQPAQPQPAKPPQPAAQPASRSK